MATVPRKMGLNWFMPALVKRSVGSLCGTTEDEGTMAWPLFSKNSRKVSRTFWPVQPPGGPSAAISGRGARELEAKLLRWTAETTMGGYLQLHGVSQAA